MSSKNSKKSSKKNKEIESENKKPPQQPEDPKNEPPANQDEIEKKALEGQEHIEDTPEEQKEEVNKEPEKPKESPKKQIVTRPRETYLKEKLNSMSCNLNLMNNIQKELGDKVKSVIHEEKVSITEVPKDLEKYISKDSDEKGKNVNEIYYTKQKYKEVKKLNDELKLLKASYNQLEQNEQILQEEGLKKMITSQKVFSQGSIFDKPIKDPQIKAIQDKKDKILDKIKGIQFQMKDLVEDHNSQTNKEKVKIFLENFKRDKEIVESRAKKYIQESKERTKRLQNDINKLIEKRKKELEKIDQQEKEEKEKKFLEFKEKEKEIEKKQSKKSQEKLLKYKPYINQLPEKKKENYLYNKRYEYFIKNEEKKFKDKYEKQKKEKEKFNYKFEDIDKFAEEFDEKIENRKYEQEQRSMELTEKWGKNREQLPRPIQKEGIDKDENSNINDNEKFVKSQNYGREVRENNIPIIDMKKKREREAIIFSLEDPKRANKKYTLNKQKKKRILLKKKDDSKPSKFNWELKLEDNKNERNNILNQYLIQRPKRVNLQPIAKTSTDISDKKPNYLQELINQKEKKNLSNKNKDEPGNEVLKVNKNLKKWENEINSKNGNIIDKINDVEEKAQKLEKEADKNERRLMLSGGIENNPELGRKVSSLLLDSIEAKINLLKKMSKVAND